MLRTLQVATRLELVIYRTAANGSGAELRVLARSQNSDAYNERRVTDHTKTSIDRTSLLFSAQIQETCEGARGSDGRFLGLKLAGLPLCFLKPLISAFGSF